MLFSYNENYIIELENANFANQKIPDDWQTMIDDHTQEIEEINALEPEDRKRVKEEITKVIHSYLEDAPASEIAEAILQYTNEPYKGYIKDKSKEWTKESSDTIIKKNLDRYETEMDDFIENQTFDTKFGKYYSNIKTFDLETEGTTYNTFTHQHKVNFIGKVRPHATNEEEVLANDKVGMQDFLNDKKPEYIKQLENRTKKDGEETYMGITEEFIGIKHYPCIINVSSILEG